MKKAISPEGSSRGFGMTVGELIENLKKFNDNLVVFGYWDTIYIPVRSVKLVSDSDFKEKIVSLDVSDN